MPLSIIIDILDYVDSESLRTACLVCKHFRDIIYNGGDDDNRMKNERSPLLEISPSFYYYYHDDDRTDRLLQQLRWKLLGNHKNNNNNSSSSSINSNVGQNTIDTTPRKEVKQYRTVKVNKLYKFGKVRDYDDFCVLRDMDMERKTNAVRFRFYGIITLDVSYPSNFVRTGVSGDSDLIYVLRAMLFNVRNIDFSNSNLTRAPLLEFAEKCPYLEKVTWNNNNNNAVHSLVSLDGMDMEDTRKLKEIYMDNSEFCYMVYGMDIREELSDLVGRYPTVWMFHKCSSALERVSIKNARYRSCLNYNEVMPITSVVPQNVLIKFVRNAPPSLHYFCSDLSHQNIDMLQHERPGIEFVT